jgi:WD40 repeat protein
VESASLAAEAATAATAARISAAVGGAAAAAAAASAATAAATAATASSAATTRSTAEAAAVSAAAAAATAAAGSLADVAMLNTAVGNIEAIQADIDLHYLAFWQSTTYQQLLDEIASISYSAGLATAAWEASQTALQNGHYAEAAPATAAAAAQAAAQQARTAVATQAAYEALHSRDVAASYGTIFNLSDSLYVASVAAELSVELVQQALDRVPSIEAVPTVWPTSPPGTVATVSTLVSVYNEILHTAVLPDGNILFTSSNPNTPVVYLVTPGGTISVFAGRANTNGFADGVGTNASFSSPWGIAVLQDGKIAVSDQNCVRIITYPGAVVSTLAGGQSTYGFDDGVGSSATFNFITSVAVLPDGNIAVSDLNNSAIRIITYPGGAVSTLGVAGPARNIAVLPDGNILVVVPSYASLYMISYPSGVVSFLDAEGVPLFSFAEQYSAAVVPSNGTILLGFPNNIRVISYPAGKVSIAPLVGSDDPGYVNGNGTSARFNNITSITVNPLTNQIIVTDTGNEVIRLITPT